jgi:hypothetical protein
MKNNITATIKLPRKKDYTPIPNTLFTSTTLLQIKLSNTKLRNSDIVSMKTYDFQTDKELNNCIIVKDIFKSLVDENIYIYIKLNGAKKIDLTEYSHLPKIYFEVIKINSDTSISERLFLSDCIILKSRDRPKKSEKIVKTKRVKSKTKTKKSKIIKNIKNKENSTENTNFLNVEDIYVENCLNDIFNSLSANNLSYIDYQNKENTNSLKIEEIDVENCLDDIFNSLPSNDLSYIDHQNKKNHSLKIEEIDVENCLNNIFDSLPSNNLSYIDHQNKENTNSLRIEEIDVEDCLNNIFNSSPSNNLSYIDYQNKEIELYINDFIEREILENKITDNNKSIFF